MALMQGLNLRPLVPPNNLTYDHETNSIVT